ncbi:MAG TPA: ABC transporter substrate-binding protein [Stellaceae bacterium]|jgi:NitT/TauT family transport system substrate-binding protein|nr:ABC transporter substrate-binding protein [Stellaceae bacterium]
MKLSFLRTALLASVTAVLAFPVIVQEARAEAIKVGISKLLSYPAVPIAIQRGYFKEQGIDATMEYFDSAQPIAVAVASGSVDFGVSGLSAAFYTLAGQGQLRMIAASGYEAPGFYNIVLLSSLKAYDAGLKSPKNLAGHSVAVTQLGTSLELNLARIAQKFGVDFKSIEIKPLQSNTNVISALTGGTVDTGIIPASPALKLIAKDEVKTLSWVGDDVPGNTGSAAYTGTKTANDRGDLVKRFLIAYRHGMKDFHDAFTDASGKRKDQAGAPAMLELMAQFTGAAKDEIEKATPYVDPQGRINVPEIKSQIAWYTSQGLIKGKVDADELIDKRYAIALPAGAK